MVYKKKGYRAWNKGLKGYGNFNKGKIRTQENKKKLSEIRLKGIKEGRIKVWNKGTKGICKAWNKDLTKDNDERINYNRPTKFDSKRAKEIRATFTLPLKDSSIEVKIQSFLRLLGIEFYTHFWMNIEHGFESDILIPSNKTIIECDGDYWHGNLNNKKIKNLNERQLEQIDKDKARTQELEDKGYRVIRLWEKDIRSMDLNKFQEVLNG